jgi:hypothetical protein
MGWGRVSAQLPTVPEYAVKAAYLYQFTKFIDWPESALGDQGQPVSFCVLGQDPFGRLLDEIEGKTVKQRRVIVKHLTKIPDAARCLVLFISASEHQRIGPILSALQNRPVLTVSDLDGFAHAGGVIEYVLQEDRVRFIINSHAGASAGIKISSKLLSLAARTEQRQGELP